MIPFSETNVALKEYVFNPEEKKPGSVWQLLCAFRECELKNDALLDIFYEMFGEKYQSSGDYAVYFFTLILGVAIFYLFNAIETQTTMLKISEDTREIVKLINTTLSGVSVFVAFILGFLVIYASNFLMKKRKKET